MNVLVSFLHFVLHMNTQLGGFVAQYGLWVYAFLFLVIFCETGLVVTAIMPGDSLIFAAGAIAATGALNVYVLTLLLIAAAFLGNLSNYFIGYKLGHLFFTNENSLFLKPSYLNKTHAFYEKYGAKTVVIARFMPIVRTFAPFVAGMGEMGHAKFVFYSFLGALFWILLLLWSSYWFGNVPAVKNHFSIVILVIIILSVLPPVVEYVRTRRHA
ncbi:MAG: DedA family protein [Pseudomonadota bacterium]|nr:DedA family protein [Gammaproteobacteria bacterium]MBU1558689.1 DedA family protein [Gammaproteobacteria bacterium]MBU1926740.1 DedA family protein [Gammaproteobacteria bacterium]MBU2546450.1 DedA family protein [Gammaproteobacteria bacterium]